MPNEALITSDEYEKSGLSPKNVVSNQQASVAAQRVADSGTSPTEG